MRNDGDQFLTLIRRQKLITFAKDEFGEDTTTELVGIAEKWSDDSTLHFNRTFELAIQIQREFGRAEELFAEARVWVHRTAEDYHPHDLQLYLKALTWVINMRRVAQN